MAVAPLFVEDMATLRTNLRLSGVGSTDALAIIDASVLEARSQMFDSLGSSVIDDLVAISYTDEPATEDDYLRLKANMLEVAWVKYVLFRDLPIMFADASSQDQQIWNEEGLTRYTSPSELDDIMEKLKLRIDELTAELILEDDVTQGTIQGGAIGPTDTPPTPGEDIFQSEPMGRWRNANG